jgi:hypothetical protein
MNKVRGKQLILARSTAPPKLQRVPVIADDRPWPEQILSALGAATWRLVRQSRARSDEAFASAMRTLTPVFTRNELAQHPATALLIALVHSLVLATFFERSEGSCLKSPVACLDANWREGSAARYRPSTASICSLRRATLEMLLESDLGEASELA